MCMCMAQTPGMIMRTTTPRSLAPGRTRVQEPLSFRALRETVQELPATIYRAKGFLNLVEYPDNSCILHVVGRRANLQISAPWGERPRESRLVFIGENGGVDPIVLEPMLDSCRAARAQAKQSAALNTAMDWLRKLRG